MGVFAPEWRNEWKKGKRSQTVPGCTWSWRLFFCSVQRWESTAFLFALPVGPSKTELEAKKSDLEKEAKSIEEQKKYMQTNEYIEEMAREKFGLVYDDEIVFKAK